MPLIAPIEESLLPPSLGPQHYVELCSLAPVQSVVASATYFSISTSLLTDPSMRDHSLSVEDLWQIKRHSRFRQHSSSVPLKLLQFEPP
ncbi:hypothetical protein QJS04_geneDACA016119 [Acorus gramineus]|uniref:Uncharacterized protein n=1 Tax=Acorus gramineus TaxID=55184 RepID=A0AAV9BWZ0_ACOGR|nr:hypothetical protein QJS04_geneDACA016119 [Acorus gramineus]